MKKSFAAAAALTVFLAAGCQKISEELPEVSGSPDRVIESGAAAVLREEFVSPVYDGLTAEEKAIYDRIRDAAADFEETVAFDPPVPKETVMKLYRLVYSQERKYFWLSSLISVPEEQVAELRLNYICGREDAELKRAELDIAASTVIGELPDGASDFDKAVYFHDRIVTSCSFSRTEEAAKSAYGVLVKGVGQCEGYASAYSLLCDKAGIPNYTVTGRNSDGDSHAWNKIILDGEWYNVDCTWDDPIIKRDNPDFVRHDYLLVKDSEIEGKTHFTDELYKNIPPCESGEHNFFAGKNLLFGTAEEGKKNFAEQIKAAGLAGKREAEVRFSSESAYSAARSELFGDGGIKKIIEDINGSSGTRIRSAYKHNNDDMLIIHISLIYESDPEI